MYQSHLKLDPSNYPVLLSVFPDEKKSYKERLVQTMFESFTVPGLYSSIGKT
jgi:actin-related protein